MLACLKVLVSMLALGALLLFSLKKSDMIHNITHITLPVDCTQSAPGTGNWKPVSAPVLCRYKVLEGLGFSGAVPVQGTGSVPVHSYRYTLLLTTRNCSQKCRQARTPMVAAALEKYSAYSKMPPRLRWFLPSLMASRSLSARLIP